MGCCHCKYLVESNRKEGKSSGAVYYCKKKKVYVNGNGYCDSFDKDYGKSSYTVNEIYHDGKEFYDDDTDPGFYLVVLITMIILGTIVNLFI